MDDDEFRVEWPELIAGVLVALLSGAMAAVMLWWCFSAIMFFGS